jgi:hypothetical protein
MDICDLVLVFRDNKDLNRANLELNCVSSRKSGELTLRELFILFFEFTVIVFTLMSANG